MQTEQGVIDMSGSGNKQAPTRQFGWQQALPKEAEQRYHYHVRARSAALLSKSVYGLIAIYLVVVVPISLFSTDVALGFWQRCVVWPIGAVLSLIWLTTRIAVLRRQVLNVLAASVAVSMTGTLYCNLNLSEGAFAQITSYQTIYILIIAFSILRIPSRMALASSLLAMAVAALATLANGVAIDLLSLLLSFLVPLVLCLVVGVLLEVADRQNFLQKHLLAEETRRIEVLHANSEQALIEQQRHARFLTLIAGNLDTAALFSRVLGFVVEQTGSQIAVAHLVDSQTGTRRVASWGATGEQDWPESAPDSLMTEALRQRQMVQLEQIPSGYLPIRTALLECRPAAVLIIPVIHADQPIAALELGRLTRFSEQEQAFVQSLCTPLAFAAQAALSRSAG